ncbi:MAG: type VI secretion system contractile sheath large subunit [Acidobacteriota bacterium]
MIDDSVRATVNLSMDPSSAVSLVERPESETPFRILLLGDFSGRRNRAAERASLSGVRALEVIVEDIDELPGRLGAALLFGDLKLKLPTLEDLHPDSLQRFVPQDFVVPTEAAATSSTTAVEADERPPLPDGGDLLGAILGGGELPPPPPKKKDALRATIDEMVAPHLVREPDAREKAFAAARARAVATGVKGVLEHPDFRELEANFLSVFRLMRRLSTGVELQVHLLDATKAEVARDLASGGREMLRILREETVGTAGAAPWAVVAAMWPLDPTEADLDLLYGLGQASQSASAPLLADGPVLLAGCDDLSAADPREWKGELPGEVIQAWAALRGSTVAPWICLTAPKVLMRPPYGTGGLSSDVDGLREAGDRFDPADYVWGSGAAFCAGLLGEAFEREGWDMKPESMLGADGMPVFVQGRGADAVAAPSTEGWINERAAEHMLDHGLTPLVTVRNRDVVRLVRWQSIAHPPQRLRGRWE